MDTIFTISGIFFLVKFLRRISRKNQKWCPWCPKKQNQKLNGTMADWVPFPGSFPLYISYEGLPGKRVQCAIVPYRSVPPYDLHSGELTSPSESPRQVKVRVAQTMSYSRKTTSFVLSYPQYVVRLTGFGMNRAWKNALIGAFRRAIVCQNGLGYAGMKGRVVLGVKPKFPYVGYHRSRISGSLIRVIWPVTG